jgi:hypothetical protein
MLEFEDNENDKGRDQMNILKISAFILMLSTVAKAESPTTADGDTTYEEEMSLQMCRSVEHRFDSASNECMYCAQGLKYDAQKVQCTGTSNVIGKCFGEDHYHAETKECMYCASGYVFNDDTDIRECIPVKEEQKEKM